MKIISRYVREQQRYTKNELKNLFSYDDQGIEQFIKNLKAYNVLKAVKNNTEQKELSDLVDENVQIADETADNDDYLYVFSYVGILTYGSRIIKVYPKYMLSQDVKRAEPVDEMKQVLRVLERYSNSEEQIINLFNGDGDNKTFNLLAVILFLLNDYHEYGVYNNSEDIIEVNGEGSILWGRTIDEGFAFIQHNRPYYTEIYTGRTVDDDTDYFKRLHECILTECSKQLRNSQLETLFDMVPVELSDAVIDDFGEKDYILEKLQKELDIQFNTRRQILLKTLYTYVAQNRKMLEEEQGISLYGTTAFNMVWEKACAEVFDNKLSVPLGNLGLSVPLSEQYDRKQKLIDIIEKPVWIGTETIKVAKETLTPDLIAIGHHDNEDYFIILDAKYYNLQLEKDKNLRGNPGVGDVTKQYLYQLAYRPFTEAHSIAFIKNCFLMPTEGEQIVNKGKARLEMLSALGLEDIQICLLPAGLIFRHYLSRTHLDISVLQVV